MNNDLIMSHNLGGKDKPQDVRDFPLGVVQSPADHPSVFMQNVAPITIFNQSKTPSCGAHAGTWFKSYKRYVELGQPTATQQFSPRSLWIEIKNDSSSPDINPEDGTDMRTIFKNLQVKGVCDITLCSNDTWLSNSQYAAGPLSAAAITNAKVNTVKSYAFLPSGFGFDDLKKATFQNGAVLLLVRVNSQMWTSQAEQISWAEKDVLPMRAPNSQHPVISGHFLVAHSYDENYVYFANSWGPTWGKNGHGYFGKDYMSQVVEGGIALDLPLDIVGQLKKLVAPRFIIGQNIVVTKPVNVRGNASTIGTVLGMQNPSAQGSVINGPIVNNGYVWWNVNFFDGPSGWVIENNIVALAQETTVQLKPQQIATTVTENWFSRLLTAFGINH